jgi:hypothetical protein
MRRGDTLDTPVVTSVEKTILSIFWKWTVRTFAWICGYVALLNIVAIGYAQGSYLIDQTTKAIPLTSPSKFVVSGLVIVMSMLWYYLKDYDLKKE